MPMSERERKVLEQLEAEFRPAPAFGAALRRPRIRGASRLVAVSAAVLVGLLSVAVGVNLFGTVAAAGVALALLGYLVLVGGGWVLVEGRRERGGLPPRLRNRPPRYFR